MGREDAGASIARSPSHEVAAEITPHTVSPLHYSSQGEELLIRLGVWFWSFLSLSHVSLPTGLSLCLQGCLSACRAVCPLVEQASSHWLPHGLRCR